jgi:hypothetical protein
MVRQLSALLAGEVSGGQAFQRHAGLSGFGIRRLSRWRTVTARYRTPGDDLLGDGASYQSSGTGTDAGRRTPRGRERVS